MASFSLEEIKKATKGNILQVGKISYCSDVSTDTRSLIPGTLFLPLSGENFNGHEFINTAIEKGASIVIISDQKYFKNISEDVAVVLVADTKQALKNLAHFYRKKFNIPVIAITGSNGKTTTKDMISRILSSKFNVCSTQKNFNNEIGLSLTLLSMTKDTEVCVVEMGMRGLGQIKELCDIADPTIGVITNVGTAHIGILGSQENIAKAKKELIDSLPDNGVAILNGDDPFVIKMGDNFKGNVIAYGLNRKYTVHGSDIIYESEGTKYICTCFDEAFKAKLHLLGIHNIYNALAATAAARVLGVDIKKIQKSIDEFVPGQQRQMILKIAGITVIDDSYNANPLSMKMAFLSLKQMKGKHHILVLGDMGELGKFERDLHYQVGNIAGEIGFDGLITVGTLSREIAKGARESGGICWIRECQSLNEAAGYLKENTSEGDVILIKGSHSMHMEKIPQYWKEMLG